MYQPVQSDENFLEPFGPLLKSEAGQDWEDDSQPSLEQKRRFIRPSAMLIHISIASLYILVITGIMWFVGHYGERFRQPDPDIYSPAGEAIEWKYTSFHLRDFYENNPFVGDPRPEHDAAWGELLKNMNVRFTEDEMQKINLTSISLKDGSGYVGTFTAYHDIHCVHWVRKWMHREHYWPFLKGEALEERKFHIEHCLESLRLKAMCYGSRAVSTYEWYGSEPRPVNEQQHKCINWEKFDAWNAERRVDLFDLDALADRPAPIPSLVEPDVDIRLGTKDGNSE